MSDKIMEEFIIETATEQVTVNVTDASTSVSLNLSQISVEEAINSQVIHTSTVVVPTTVSELQIVVPGAQGIQGEKGEKGDKGDPGEPGNKSYTHHQLLPAAVWLIEHNMGFYPAITIVNSAGSTVYGEERYIDTNIVEVSFSASFGGKAYLS